MMSTVRTYYEERLKNEKHAVFLGVLAQWSAPRVVSDKLHEMVNWRSMLSGLFRAHTHILETGEGFHAIGRPSGEQPSRRLFPSRSVNYTDAAVRGGGAGAAPVWVILAEKSALQRKFSALCGRRAECCAKREDFTLYRLREAKEIVAFFER